MKEVFVKKANARFDSKFNYEQFEYVNAKTKSVIVCPVHGPFEQSPDKHLHSIHPCPGCWGERRKEISQGRIPVCKREALSKEDYLERVRERYGDKFEIDLSGYHGRTIGTVKLICPIHGESSYVPSSLLISACGCNKCGMEKKNRSKTFSYSNFLEKSNEIHSFRYSYPSNNADTYENRKSIIDIVCPEHGLFQKKAQNHLSGQGCFQCKVQQLVQEGKLPGGYTTQLFEKKPELKSKEAIVYYLKVGNLYKIGITTNFDGRFRNIKSESKKEVEVIDTLKTSLFDAYQLEQSILGKYDDYRMYRRWSTELFSKDVLNGKSLKDC